LQVRRRGFSEIDRDQMATKETIEPLTGLRGIAALLVVHSHYFFWCAPYTTESIPRHLLNASNTANFGMSLFFTLSGFVITYHYWNFGWRESPAAAFFRFLFLRLSRLYPVFLLFFLLQFKSTSIDADFYGDRWFSAALIHVFNLESWYPIQFKNALVDGSGYFVSWSISTEIGMYLIFATALVLAGRFTRRVGPVLAATATIYVALTVVAVNFNDTVGPALARLPNVYDALEPNYAWRWFYYLSPYFRLTQFIFGAFAAMLVLKEWDVGLRFHLSNLSTISAALILVLYIDVIVSGKISPETSQLLQSALFAIMMANGRANTLLNRALSNKALVFFGLISYSLYLFHRYPATWAGASQVKEFTWPLFGQYAFNFCLTLLFAAILSWGLYSTIEMPAQKWLRTLLPRRWKETKVPAADAPIQPVRA